MCSYYVINFVKGYFTLLSYAHHMHYSGADKSLARPGRKQATVTEDFDVHISYL